MGGGNIGIMGGGNRGSKGRIGPVQSYMDMRKASYFVT